MKTIILKLIKKVQVLTILIVGICILIYVVSGSNEVAHKKVISNFSELKQLFGQQDKIDSDFKIELIAKCKVEMLNSDKLLPSEIKFCNDIGVSN